MKMDASFPTIKNCNDASYFVEIQDDLLTNTRFEDHSDEQLHDFNQRLLNVDRSRA